ncbi:MAG TPA: cysteine desulfurase family protein, partial [Bacteroidota bacterium]|nr:cysteine desulfurase family protein [Bacteroidota bacterium]
MRRTLALFRQIRENLSSQFRRPIYFDTNATTPIDPIVQKRMARVQKHIFGNASSLHMFGSAAREVVEEARRSVARVINAEPSEIIFTSGGTEANTTVIKSAAAGASAVGNTQARAHFITSRIEHPSVLETFRRLEARGFDVTYLSVDAHGCVSVSELESALRITTLLVSIMHVNNELGTIQPIAEIAKRCASRGIPFHSDCVQSFGKLPIDIRTLPIDFLTCSAHKINGPKGAGAIFMRQGVRLNPLLEGGHQERLLRAGTEAVGAIAGFGKACDVLSSIDPIVLRNQSAPIKSIVIDGMRQVFPEMRINGSTDHSLHTTLNMTLSGIPNAEILAYLDFYNIAVSVGSACVAGSSEVSHVLAALGVSDDDIRSSFRISFGRFNTEQEARSFVSVLGRFARDRKEFFSYLMPGELLAQDVLSGSVTLVDVRSEDQRRET